MDDAHDKRQSVDQNLSYRKKNSLSYSKRSELVYLISCSAIQMNVCSLNNWFFGYYVDRVYPTEFEIKYTIGTFMTSSYLDLHQEINSEARLRSKLLTTEDEWKQNSTTNVMISLFQ